MDNFELWVERYNWAGIFGAHLKVLETHGCPKADDFGLAHLHWYEDAQRGTHLLASITMMGRPRGAPPYDKFNANSDTLVMRCGKLQLHSRTLEDTAQHVPTFVHAVRAALRSAHEARVIKEMQHRESLNGLPITPNGGDINVSWGPSLLSEKAEATLVETADPLIKLIGHKE